MVLPHWAGIDVVAWAKWSGVILTLATWWLTAILVARSVRGTGAPPAIAMFGAATAVLALAVLPATPIHAVAGLCTPSFTFVTMALVVACVDQVRQPSARRARWLGVLALLCGLARPEGNLVAMAALVVTWAVLPADHRSRLGRAVAGFYLLPGAVYFAARWAYFGLPLPLPIYVKLRHPEAFAGADDGISNALGLWWSFGWVLIAMAIPGLSLWRRCLWSVPIAALVVIVGAALPSHIMGYCWRYLYPSLPMLAALAGIGSVAMLLRLARPLWRVVLSLALPLAVVGIGFAAGEQEAHHHRAVYSRGLAAAHEPLGRFLAAQADGGRVLSVATGEGGVIPYRSGWRTIDTFGLGNAEAARTGKHDARRVMSERPDVLVALSRSAWHFVPCLPWEAELVAAAQADGMVRGKVLWFSDEYHLWVFVRPGPMAIAMSDWQPAAGVPDPFGSDAAPTGSVSQLQPLGLRYPALELVEALVWQDRVAVRVRGVWDPALHRIVVEHGVVAPEAATVDFGPDPRLVGRSAGELVHTLVLPRVLAPGQRLRIGLIAATAPYGRIAAADGRGAAEVVVR
jgi:hypothetical protein